LTVFLSALYKLCMSACTFSACFTATSAPLCCSCSAVTCTGTFTASCGQPTSMLQSQNYLILACCKPLNKQGSTSRAVRLHGFDAVCEQDLCTEVHDHRATYICSWASTRLLVTQTFHQNDAHLCCCLPVESCRAAQLPVILPRLLELSKDLFHLQTAPRMVLATGLVMVAIGKFCTSCKQKTCALRPSHRTHHCSDRGCLRQQRVSSDADMPSYMR